MDLGADILAIELLIESGKEHEASTRLMAASQGLAARRPEYRYLFCLYDAVFRMRPDTEIIKDAVSLLAEQPEMLEIASLLTLLHARSGDRTHAESFGRLALHSTNPTARDRAARALAGKWTSLPPSPSGRPDSRPPPSSSRPLPPTRLASLTIGRLSSTPEPRQVQETTKATDEQWFATARRERLHRRMPTYGVRPVASMAELLLDWGLSVAAGRTALSPEPLALSRASLVLLDASLLALRKGRPPGTSAKTYRSFTLASAGFLTAVLLHELDAKLYETAPDDGGCKVVLPSGAGVRPITAASAFADGTGPSLTQVFDRLATAQELATVAGSPLRSTSSIPSGAGDSQRVRTGIIDTPRPRLAAISSAPPHSPPPYSSPPSSAPPSSAPPPLGDELALTRPEVERTTIRVLSRPIRSADPPPLSMPQIAHAFVESPTGIEISLRTGTTLTKTARGVAALESYCESLRGTEGVAPNRPGWVPSDDEEDIILAWGAFLGETLIATFGGVWECDPNAPSDPRLFRVICQDRVAAWPVSRVYLRLKEGSLHSMAAFLSGVGDRLEQSS